MANKKQMTEAEIRENFIDPALESKWKGKIKTEVQITDGAVDLRGNLVFRQPPKRADYVLYREDNYPIAIVEAKDNNHSVAFGLQQAMTYARMLDVPFAFSSNGDAFAEYDGITGHTTDQSEFIALDDFPSPDDLIAEADGKYQPTDAVKKIEHQPYYSSQTTWPPRYYQRIAINRTLDAIARGRNRLMRRWSRTMALTVLFIIHNVFNRRWYKVILKGRYTKRRILSTAINSACALSIIVLVVSGISMARHSMAAPLLPMGAARILHMTAAYWGFVFISMHAGLHMTAALRKAVGKRFGKIAIAAITIIGIWAFLKERFPYYMFLIEDFVFFDFSTPLPLLAAEYALIMLLFMFIGAALSVALSLSRKE